MPLTRVLILSATSFRKMDSDLDGMMVVVIGMLFVVKEITIEPNLLEFSVTEIKYPFSNF